MARFVFYETPPEATARQVRLRAEIAAHSFWLAGAKLAALAAKAGFNPAQPRVPAGNPAGGQWAPGGGSARRTPRKRRLTEADVNKMPYSAERHDLRAAVRKPYVLAGGGGNFTVAPNPSANPNAPIGEIPFKSQVAANDDAIIYVAGKENIDPDIIRAVMYVETTHGWYDDYTSPYGLNDTILPMNVSVSNWAKPLGLSRSDLEQPLKNIEAGARILKGIMANLPQNAPISVTATLYNDLGAAEINSYGARVEAVYKAKLWKKH